MGTGLLIAHFHGMSAALFVALLALLPAGIAVGATEVKHPDRKCWKQATIGKGAIGRVTAGAGVAQLRNTPSKYGGGASGFGKRLGAAR